MKSYIVLSILLLFTYSTDATDFMPRQVQATRKMQTDTTVCDNIIFNYAGLSKQGVFGYLTTVPISQWDCFLNDLAERGISQNVNDALDYTTEFSWVLENDKDSDNGKKKMAANTAISIPWWICFFLPTIVALIMICTAEDKDDLKTPEAKKASEEKEKKKKEEQQKKKDEDDKKKKEEEEKKKQEEQKSSTQGQGNQPPVDQQNIQLEERKQAGQAEQQQS